MEKHNVEFHKNELVWTIHDSDHEDSHSNDTTLFCDFNSCVEVVSHESS